MEAVIVGLICLTVPLGSAIVLIVQTLQILSVMISIKRSRTEFHDIVVELTGIYLQKFPKLERLNHELSQSESCETAISQQSADLPVELPPNKDGPSSTMAFDWNNRVWLRFSPSIEGVVKEMISSSSKLPENFGILKTEETHHNFPILNVAKIESKSVEDAKPANNLNVDSKETST